MTAQPEQPLQETAQEPALSHVLLVANRTCPCPDVLDTVSEHAGAAGRVHIVAPALNSRLRHYVSDVDAAVAAAQERLDRALAHLRMPASRPPGRLETVTRSPP